MRKIYVVRKYVVASSVEEALQKEKKIPVDDCWLEEQTQKDWLEEKSGKNLSKIGFYNEER